MAKKLDPKAKAKREKVIAVVAGGVLLAVLAITLPMTMKLMKPQKAASAAAPAATTGATTMPSSTAAIESGGAPVAGLGQLDSFSRFDSKDPFHQQVDPHSVVGPETPGRGQHGAAADEPGSSAGSAGAVPQGPTAAPAPPNTAVITVNGGPPQKITIGQDFPLPPFDPIFHLVSVVRNAVEISIAGGSLSNGRATVTLRKKQPLTLMNTADGTEYELRLLWTGSGVPPTSILPPTPTAGSPVATTPSSATPPAGSTVSTPATTSTTTTTGS
jgi:hypothetical protein